MIVGIVSDIHGNLPALEAVEAQLRHVDQVICLGDVVNYGPWSDECLELLQTLPQFLFLEGNHEAMFLGKTLISREIPLVREFYRITKERFRRLDLIKGLPRETSRWNYLFTHTLNEAKIYPETPITPPGNCFVGHTHCAFAVERGGFRVVNPGSVGQNRARLDLASYALFDSESGKVTLSEITYSTDLLLAEMQARNYPPECLAYYRKKVGK